MKPKQDEYSRVTLGEFKALIYGCFYWDIQLNGKIAARQNLTTKYETALPYSAARKSQCIQLIRQVQIDLGLNYRANECCLDDFDRFSKDSVLTDKANQLYWRFMNSLVRWDAYARFDIAINPKAKITEDEFKGIKVKSSFYTARYSDWCLDDELGGVNHAQTYVIDGRQFKVDSDILVRTGNGIAGIKPVVRKVDEAKEVSIDKTNYVDQRFHRKNLILIYYGFRTRNIPEKIRATIDDRLKLTESFDDIAEMHAVMGGGQHPAIMALTEIAKSAIR